MSLLQGLSSLVAVPRVAGDYQAHKMSLGSFVRNPVLLQVILQRVDIVSRIVSDVSNTFLSRLHSLFVYVSASRHVCGVYFAHSALPTSPAYALLYVHVLRLLDLNKAVPKITQAFSLDVIAEVTTASERCLFLKCVYVCMCW